ncbi:MAG: hypothetical protein CMQ20_12900 [Gammaproteobacteria bacterium]|jgi:hypothetical protein|nr:hypothetical protein [Gammaproteobacteria bacterium]|tara:strand:- start:1312 stop:1686 length:375 start_codon:yes stop_codon:yes gene_type:complete
MNTLIERLNADDMLSRHGAYYTTQIAIVSGDDTTCFDIKEGKISRLDSESPDGGFSLIGSRDAWDRYCADVPPPEFNELGAMLGTGHVTVKGEMSVMQSNFMFVRRLVELWREDRIEVQRGHNK